MRSIATRTEGKGLPLQDQASSVLNGLATTTRGRSARRRPASTNPATAARPSAGQGVPGRGGAVAG